MRVALMHAFDHITTRTAPGRMATGIVESAFVASPVWLRCDFVDDAVERSTDGVAALEYS